MALQSHIARATNQLIAAPAAEPLSPHINGDHVSEFTRNLPVVQQKMIIGSPDDPYEREADRVADRVVRLPINNKMKCEVCQHEEEPIQRKPFDISAFSQRNNALSFREDERVQKQPFNINAFDERHNPERESGQRLIAQEFPYVTQQSKTAAYQVQRKEARETGSKEVPEVYVKLILRPGKGTDGSMTIVTEEGKQIGVNVTYQGNPNPGVYHYINRQPMFDLAEMGGKGLGGFIVKYDNLPEGLCLAEEYDLVVIDTRLFSEHGVYQLSNVELAELTELTEGFSDYDFRVLKKYGSGKARTFDEAKELIEKMREGKFDYEILQLEQENLKSELYGTEKTYNLYKAYKCNANQNVSAMGINMCFLKHSDVYLEYLDSPGDLKKELEDQLRLIGYTSSDPISEFEGHISQFIANYEKIAEDLALRSLDNSQAIAEAEIEKYSSSKDAAQMHKDLVATRKHMASARSLAAQSVIAQLDGNDESGREHKQLSDNEVRKGQEEYAKLSTKYPLLSLYKMDDILDEDQDFFTPGNIITALQNKTERIRNARREVQKNPDCLYKLDVLKELVYAKQGITKGSTIDLIITDKAAQLEADESFVDNILLVISLALIPFTMGQSAILAFGVGATLTGISIYSAMDAIDTYANEKMFYDAGLSADDPSVFWVVVAVAGVGLEMGSAVSAFSKASSIAKKYPDLAVDLDKLVTEVQATRFTDNIAKLGTRMDDVEALIQQSIIKQARVQQELDLAFKAAAGKLSSRLGSNLLLDPQNFKTLVDLAYQLAKRGFYKFEEYLLMLNRRGIVKDLNKLTSQELARLKKAYTGSIEATIQDVQASKQRATFHSYIDDELDSADELIGSSDETLEHAAKREPYADDPDFPESIRDEELVPGVNAPRSDSSTSDLDNLEPRRGLIYEKQLHSANVGVAKGKAAAKKHKLRWLFDNPKGLEHNVSGIDSIYTDAAGNFYIVEFKGGSATLTKDQMKRDWVNRKIAQIEKDPNLKDHPFVKELREAFDNNRLRGRTYSTPVDPTTGKIGPTTMQDHGIF